MVEIEKTEFVDADGSIKKSYIIRAASIRTTYKDGTVTEMGDLPDDFMVEQGNPDAPGYGVLPKGFWHLPDCLFEMLHRRVREVGVGNDLLPRSIALLNEHGETLIELAEISMYLTRAAETKSILIGYEDGKS